MINSADTDIPEFNSSEPNIGREVHQYMKSARMSATWLAGRMCCDRTNIYKILGRRSLDTATLYKISYFLQHDFFSVYTKAFEELNEKNKENSHPQ